MSAGDVFSAVNLIALCTWVLLAVWPRRQRLPQVVAGVVVPALLAVLYIALVATQWRPGPGGFSTIEDVALLFRNPWMLLAGWVHYLAFDLLVGSWEARDARDRGIPQVLLAPCLFLTFMFGPAGWFAYLGLRSAYRPPAPAGAPELRP